eukprot:42492-Rhodomonas_salina.1
MALIAAPNDANATSLDCSGVPFPCARPGFTNATLLNWSSECNSRPSRSPAIATPDLDTAKHSTFGNGPATRSAVRNPSVDLEMKHSPVSTCRSQTKKKP